MLLPVFLCFALSALSCWILVRFLIPKLSCDLLDQPNARSSHRQPTPRGGGMAFVLVSVVCSLNALLLASLPPYALHQSLLPLISLPLAVVGFLDDRFNLPATWRYGVQVLTACLMLWISPIPHPLLLLPLMIVAVTGDPFINFMDGLDGLVAGCLCVAVPPLQLSLPRPGRFGLY